MGMMRTLEKGSGYFKHLSLPSTSIQACSLIARQCHFPIKTQQLFSLNGVKCQSLQRAIKRRHLETANPNAVYSVPKAAFINEHVSLCVAVWGLLTGPRLQPVTKGCAKGLVTGDFGSLQTGQKLTAVEIIARCFDHSG